MLLLTIIGAIIGVIVGTILLRLGLTIFLCPKEIFKYGDPDEIINAGTHVLQNTTRGFFLRWSMRLLIVGFVLLTLEAAYDKRNKVELKTEVKVQENSPNKSNLMP